MIGWPASPKQVALNTLKYFGLPAVFCVGIFWVYIRNMRILGTTGDTLWVALGDIALHLLGFASFSGLRAFAGLLALELMLYGIWRLYKAGREEWIFFTAVFFLVPELVLLVWHRSPFCFRYFCVTFPFFYLLLAWIFARWHAKHGLPKLTVLLLAAGITLGHGFKVANLIRVGRGHYRMAVLAMAAATPGPVISVFSDHDFRNPLMLSFYSRFLGPAKKIDYFTWERCRQEKQEKPEWLVTHSVDLSIPPQPFVISKTFGIYKLFGVFPYCGFSGWNWYVYHHAGATNAINPAHEVPSPEP